MRLLTYFWLFLVGFPVPFGVIGRQPLLMLDELGEGEAIPLITLLGVWLYRC